MKNKLLLFIFSFLAIVTLSAQGIEFFHGTWEEALLKAKTEDKIIFVDAFTTWCGPCKNMAANTFPDPEVGKLFNTNFVCMKIDMEKEMGLQFRKKHDVTAYPTLFFIDFDEVEVQKSVGAKSPAALIALGESVVAKYDKSARYATAYNEGDRSYQLVYDYVAALNKSGKPSVKIANDYLEGQTDLTTPENLKFILESASQVDCQCFDLFEKHKSEIAKIVPEEAIHAKVRQACENTVERAIEFESPELIPLAAEAMKRNIPAEADRFRSESEIKYALALHDLSRISDMVNTYVKKYAKNEPETLNQLALDLDKYAGDNKACQDLSVTLSGKAADDKEATADYVANNAKLVYKYKGKDAAIEILDEALRKYNNEEDKDFIKLKALRNKIENS